MSIAILFHFLCTRHVSDINISIIRSLRLCCWIITSVVLFSVGCVLEVWCGWVWVVSVLRADACASACNTDTTQIQPHQIFNTQRTENKTTDVIIQQHSRKLLMIDILMSETWWVHKKWNKIASDIKWSFILQQILSDFIDCLYSLQLNNIVWCAFVTTWYIYKVFNGYDISVTYVNILILIIL